MNEEQAAAKHIYATLAAASDVTDLASTRIHESLAPLGTAFPHIIFNQQSGGNDRTVPGGDQRMMARGAWLVKAVTDSNGYSEADALYAAIDAALMGTTGVVTIGSQSYTVLSIVRISPVRYIEPADGKRYFHVGGLYRVQVTSRS